MPTQNLIEELVRDFEERYGDSAPAQFIRRKEFFHNSLIRLSESLKKEMRKKVKIEKWEHQDFAEADYDKGFVNGYNECVDDLENRLKEL